MSSAGVTDGGPCSRWYPTNWVGVGASGNAESRCGGTSVPRGYPGLARGTRGGRRGGGRCSCIGQAPGARRLAWADSIQGILVARASNSDSGTAADAVAPGSESVLRAVRRRVGATAGRRSWRGRGVRSRHGDVGGGARRSPTRPGRRGAVPCLSGPRATTTSSRGPSICGSSSSIPRITDDSTWFRYSAPVAVIAGSSRLTTIRCRLRSTCVRTRSCWTPVC